MNRSRKRIFLDIGGLGGYCERHFVFVFVFLILRFLQCHFAMQHTGRSFVTSLSIYSSTLPESPGQRASRGGF